MPSSIVDVESFSETKRKLLRFEYDLYKTIANSYKKSSKYYLFSEKRYLRLMEGFQ